MPVTTAVATPRVPLPPPASQPRGAVLPPDPVPARVANNQCSYRVTFDWAAHAPAPLPAALLAKLPAATDACPSVTTAFLQAVRVLATFETERPGGRPDALGALAAAARRTKLVALTAGSHRVPDEARRHALSDGRGMTYATNLDRNRYGDDRCYLHTVLTANLAVLHLCPRLITVAVADAKSGCITNTQAPAPCACACAAPVVTMPPPRAAPPAAAVAAAGPPQGGAPGAKTIGSNGIGMLLDALTHCGFRPPPSPFAKAKAGRRGGGQASAEAHAHAWATGAFEGLQAASRAGRLEGAARDPFSPAYAAAPAPPPPRKRLDLGQAADADSAEAPTTGCLMQPPRRRRSATVPALAAAAYEARLAAAEAAAASAERRAAAAETECAMLRARLQALGVAVPPAGLNPPGSARKRRRDSLEVVLEAREEEAELDARRARLRAGQTPKTPGWVGSGPTPGSAVAGCV